MIDAADLRTVEATLTGESLPVGKDAELLAEDTTFAERRDMVYQGTTVAAGAGRVVITDTGVQPEACFLEHVLRAAP